MLVLEGADLHRAVAIFPADAVLDGVLHQGLHGQGRDLEAVRADLVYQGQLVPEAYLFDITVIADMLQFLGKRDHTALTDGIDIGPEIFGEIVDQIVGTVRIQLDQRTDGAKRIIDKMGLDLADHQPEPGVLQLSPDPRSLLPLMPCVHEQRRKQAGDVAEQPAAQVISVPHVIHLIVQNNLRSQTHSHQRHPGAFQLEIRVQGLFPAETLYNEQQQHQGHDCKTGVGDPGRFHEIRHICQVQNVQDKKVSGKHIAEPPQRRLVLPREPMHEVKQVGQRADHGQNIAGHGHDIAEIPYESGKFHLIYHPEGGQHHEYSQTADRTDVLQQTAQVKRTDEDGQSQDHEYPADHHLRNILPQQIRSQLQRRPQPDR